MFTISKKASSLLPPKQGGGCQHRHAGWLSAAEQATQAECTVTRNPKNYPKNENIVFFWLKASKVYPLKVKIMKMQKLTNIFLWKCQNKPTAKQTLLNVPKISQQ